MTKDEAEVRWCPMARVAVTESVSVNRGFLDDSKEVYHCFCISDSCMMWQDNPCKPGEGWCGLVKI